MPRMRVSHCCCGCSLRTGTIAIGFFYAIIGALVFITVAAALGVITTKPQEKLNHEQVCIQLLLVAVAIEWQRHLRFALCWCRHTVSYKSFSEMRPEGTYRTLYFPTNEGQITSGTANLIESFLEKLTDDQLIVFSVGLAVAFIQTAVSVCLIYGGMQEKMNWLAPWIVYAVIGAVLTKLHFVTLILRHQPGDGSFVVSVSVQAVQVVLFIYFLLVVCSYRTSLLQRKENKVFLVEPQKSSLP